ncbi:MAG TPA: hypothetical protein VG815_21495 [Chloroflexota bacterium]|jgi:hypothetical protein|nr:hypothetical protein [Chloroflexota bacterium]
MKLGCLLPILAIGLVGVGGQGLYVGLTNRTPTVMSYQEFLQKKPSSGWIEISDARLDLLTAIHESNRFTGTIKRVYIPIRPAATDSGEGEGPIHLLLLTKDEAILNTLKDLEAVTGGGGGLIGRLKRQVEANKKGAAGTEPEPKDSGLENAIRFMIENQDKVRIDRPVRGLLQFGLDSKSRDRRKIQGLNPDIAPDFAVLEDGAQPELATSAFMVIAGLGLAGLYVARLGRARSSTEPASGSPGESSPPAGPESPNVT